MGEIEKVEVGMALKVIKLESFEEDNNLRVLWV